VYTDAKLDAMLVQAGSVAPADPIALARLGVGLQPMMIDKLWATITTVTAVAIVTLTFKWRPTPGSATAEVAIGTLVLPIGAVVGKQYYKNVTPYKALPGGEVVVQAAGASATGNAHIGVSYSNAWDAPLNNANMIAST